MGRVMMIYQNMTKDLSNLGCPITIECLYLSVGVGAVSYWKYPSPIAPESLVGTDLCYYV